MGITTGIKMLLVAVSQDGHQSDWNGHKREECTSNQQLFLCKHSPLALCHYVVY